MRRIFFIVRGAGYIRVTPISAGWDALGEPGVHFGSLSESISTDMPDVLAIDLLRRVFVEGLRPMH